MMRRNVQGRLSMGGRPTGAVPGCDDPGHLPRAGTYRLERINPDCKSEYWRPFSCKVFHSVSLNGRGFAHEG